MKAKNLELLRKALHRIDDADEYHRQARCIIAGVIWDEENHKE